MKIPLLIVNLAVFVYSGVMMFLALATLGLGGTKLSLIDTFLSNSVISGIFIMTLASLVGMIGMAWSWRRPTKTLYYIFALIGIALPVVVFQFLSLPNWQ